MGLDPFIFHWIGLGHKCYKPTAGADKPGFPPVRLIPVLYSALSQLAAESRKSLTRSLTSFLFVRLDLSLATSLHFSTEPGVSLSECGRRVGLTVSS